MGTPPFFSGKKHIETSQTEEIQPRYSTAYGSCQSWQCYMFAEFSYNFDPTANVAFLSLFDSILWDDTYIASFHYREQYTLITKVLRDVLH
jgi:hypothetical protein